MMTEVVECEDDTLRIGMGLEVTFRAGVPVFRPRSGAVPPPSSSVPSPPPRRKPLPEPLWAP